MANDKNSHAGENLPAAQPPRRYQFLLMALLVLLWADALFKLGFYALYQPLTNPVADYLKHWQAAKQILVGNTPYKGDTDLYLGFNYPLLTAYLFFFLGFMTAETGKAVWIILNAVFTVSGALLAGRFLRPEPPKPEEGLAYALRDFAYRHWYSLAFIATMNFQPLLHGFPAANIDPLNYVLFIALAAALVRRYDKTAGVITGVLVLIKVAPALLVIPIIAARRWRMLATFSATLAAYAAVLLITGAWQTELFLYQDVLPQIGFHYLHISYSTHKILAMMLNPASLETLQDYNRWVFTINIGLLAIYTGVCAWWGLRVRTRAEHLFGFCMVMLVLLSPLLEYHHFVWAAPLLFFQIRDWVSGQLSNRAMLLCVVAWVVLLFVRILNDFAASPLGFPYMCFAPAAGALLAAVSAAIAFRRPATR